MSTQEPTLPDTEPTTTTEKPLATSAQETVIDPKPFEQKQLILITLSVALGAILIGLFLWYQALNTMPAPQPDSLRPTAAMNNEPESTTAEAETESFGALSTSNEIEAIEADLESTNLDSLESELIQISTELEAAL